MAIIGIDQIIILITCCIIFGIFLCYDLFRKGEKYGYLAYITAVIPADYVWALGYDVLGVYMILFILWIVCLLRDLLFVYRKDKEYDDILLFLGLGILVQLILTAILPSDTMILGMQQNGRAARLGPFYLPNMKYLTDTTYVSSSILLGFRLAATLMILLAILPMLLDLKSSEEHVPFIVLLIVDLIFIPPFLYLSFIWVPQATAVLTLLMSVLLFVVLLMITKERGK